MKKMRLLKLHMIMKKKCESLKGKINLFNHYIIKNNDIISKINSKIKIDEINIDEKINLNVNFIYYDELNSSNETPYYIIVDNDTMIEKLIFYLEFIRERNPQLLNYYETNENLHDVLHLDYKKESNNTFLVKGFKNIFKYIIDKIIL